MRSSNGGYFLNESFEGDKPTSVESIQQKEIMKHAEKESGHAKPTQGSNRNLLALVIIVCLTSLAVLSLTILMFGKNGDGRDYAANEGSSSASPQSLISHSAEIKDLGKNFTSLQLALFPGCQGPCNNGIISYPADQEGKYECVCDPGFYGKYCDLAARSCKEVYDFSNFTTSGLVTLHVGSTLTSVFCHVGDFGCGDGAWTPVIKIDGNKSTFHYDSDYWSNRAEYNLPGGETGFDSQETKLPTYWDTSFNKICLGMKMDQQIRFITINTTETSSLYSLIADGNYRATSLGYKAWKTLLDSHASLQLYCKKEGFNVACSGSSSSGNNENDCHSCDSRIGFGMGGSPDNSNTCGNEARWSPDNGIKTIKAMGYILVQ